MASRRPVAWPSLRIPIRCSAARWTTRWCRPWRAPSCNAAGRRCVSTSAGSAPAPACMTPAGASCRTCWPSPSRWPRTAQASALRWPVFRLARLSPAMRWPPSGPRGGAGIWGWGFVASHGLAALWPQGRVEHLVLVGLAASRCAAAPLPPEAHLRTLVVHGEHDDTVPLSAVLDWARPQILPVTVIPAGGHFFHGQLPLLKSLVLRHLRSVAAPP